MGILYLIDNFSLGGAQTVVKGLMEQDGADEKYHAIALRRKHPEMHIDHPRAITYHSVSKYNPRVMTYLRRYISDHRIEVLHCQLPRSILLGYLMKRRFPEIKYIIHEQGDIFESRIHALLLRMFRRRADAFLACSKATASMLTRRSHVDPGEITLLYNYVDLGSFVPASASSFQGRKIGFAGRIERRKGWREFIAAAVMMNYRMDVSFYLAGTGTEEKKLRQAIEKEAEVPISFLGYVADMPAFYRDMDLLVIPSHFEPMGMVALEAMACGVPVLAADVPGLNEVVKHKRNGWTYAGRSGSQLKKAIEEVLDSDPQEVRTIVDQGIKDARKYSLPEFSTRLRKFHESLKNAGHEPI
jgi:glycosyltransferase involved in cell wall biosynthesis